MEIARLMLLDSLLVRMARERPDRAILRSFEPLLFEWGGEAKKLEAWNHKKLESLVAELLDEVEASELENAGVVRRDYASEAGEFAIKITRSADLKNGDVLFFVIEPQFYESVVMEESFGILGKLRARWRGK